MTAHRLDTTPSSLNEPAVTQPRAASARPRPAPAGTAAPQPSRRATTGRSAPVLAYVDVVHALCDLDRVDHVVLRLIYWHGRTQAQVAEELHLPIGTVSAAVARGMRQLAGGLTAG